MTAFSVGSGEIISIGAFYAGIVGKLLAIEIYILSLSDRALSCLKSVTWVTAEAGSCVLICSFAERVNLFAFAVKA